MDSSESMQDKSRKNVRHRPPDQADDERSLAEEFGIKVHYLPDEQAPPVDLDLLEKYIRQELSPEKTTAVCHLLANFRVWHDACTTLLRSRPKK